MKDTSDNILLFFFKFILNSTLLFCPLLVCISACENRKNDSYKTKEVKQDKFSFGKLAPEIEGLDTEGKAIKLSDYRGTPVLVSFYATWCAPCLKELPDLIELDQKGLSLDSDLKSEDSTLPIRVIMINTDSPAYLDEVKLIKDKYKMTMPIILDPEMIAVSKFEVSGFPESFLLDPEGKFLEVNDPEKKEKLTRIISTRNWRSKKMNDALVNSIKGIN